MMFCLYMHFLFFFLLFKCHFNLDEMYTLLLYDLYKHGYL